MCVLYIYNIYRHTKYDVHKIGGNKKKSTNVLLHRLKSEYLATHHYRLLSELLDTARTIHSYYITLIAHNALADIWLIARATHMDKLTLIARATCG